HGSWDRSPPAPPRITVMWADTDGKNARVTDFVNGFEVLGAGSDSNTSHYFGRPVSVIEGGDSALYVSDDLEGVVYRIAYTGAPSSVSDKTTGANFEVGPIIPNPASNEFQTQITLAAPAQVQAELFDVLGNEVISLLDGGLSTGDYPLIIGTAGLAQGTYYVRVSSGGKSISRRIVIAR
ncbi:MAG TPA: T9SS type A sorting domain-containing protein, partial [Candidatus Kapabacteria bacterium]|nr:T9SS type A sorting domain-containing protein [Candidatus Kapabacteria bacterium]